MPVAVATGEGHPDLLALGDSVPMLDLRHVTQIGVRSVDSDGHRSLVVSPEPVR